MIRRCLALLVAGAVFAAGAAFATKFSQSADDAAESLALHAEAVAVEDRAYPAIMPVLDMADQLSLSEFQRQQLRALANRVQGESNALRREIAQLEKRLDRGFAEQTIDPLRIDGLTARIGQLEGRLRAAELLARLDAKAILLPEQLALFAKLGHAGSVAEVEPAERPIEEF